MKRRTGSKAAATGSSSKSKTSTNADKRAARERRLAPKIGKVLRSDVSPVRPAKTANPASIDVKLTRVAYKRILSAIIYGPLDLGEPLSENDLANALGVSKAPIRESLNELRLEGLVVVVPQSGSYVFSPTAEQIEELCDFRSLLEDRALRLSMQKDAKALIRTLRDLATEMKHSYDLADVFRTKRLDTEFHNAIIHFSGNRYLIRSYSSIGHSVEALRHRFMDTAIYRNQAFDEHQKIVDLLARNNIPKATEVLHDHIARTKKFQARANWPTGRLRRKDYKFRDYSEIFAEA